MLSRGRHLLWFVLVTCTSTAIVAQQDSQQGSYLCQHKTVDEVVRLLRPLIPESSGARVFIDQEQNRFRVVGPGYVQAIAHRLLKEVDKPSPRPAATPIPTAPPPVMQSYRIRGALQTEFQQEVQRRFPRSRTSADPSSGVVFVNAAAGEHAEIDAIAKQIASGKHLSTNAAPRLLTSTSPFVPVDRPTRGPAETQPTSALPQAPQTASEEDRLVRFLQVPPQGMDRLQQQILAIFNTRLEVRSVGNRQVFVMKTLGKPPGQVELEFDRTRNGLLVGGTSTTVAQMVRLVSTLTRDAGAGRKSQVFRLRRENHAKLKRLIRQSSSLPPVPRDGSSLSISRRNSRVHRLGSEPTSDLGVSQAAYLYQDAEAQEVQDPVPEGLVRQFEGVEVESLPELDVIILRGSDQDLDQLAEVIQQLERISRETQAEVRIRPLRHAQSEAVAELIGEVREDLVGGRQGRVSVLPLVKPNAILLIGWGDAVAAVQELINQLDQPVAADSQSHQFRLKHASASEISQTLEDFFQNRTGLGPRLRTAVDARTNSLIVYAAPRDLAEVQRLVSELDRPQGEAVDRARVVKINHALAADVAETLTQAIEASVGGTGGRSASLELQTFDPDGQRILRSGTLRHVQITPNPRNNTLIVTSPIENLELIEELVRQLDTPVGQVKIKVFRITNGDASALIDTLRSLIPSQEAGVTGPQLSSAPGETGLAPLRFSVDIRSNSIIATGSEGDLRIVEALLTKLDQTTNLQRRTAVYRLKNSPAIDVASAVNQYLYNRRVIESAIPGADNPFQEIEREVVVVPEPVANKLILAATPRYFREISELIEKLDEQPPQVVIQVLIAEVTLNNADEFGVELGLQDSVLFDRSLLGDLITTTNTATDSTADGIVTTTNELIQAATNLPGFAFNSIQPLGNSGSEAALAGANTVGGQGISNFAVGRGNDELGFGGLVLSASSRNVSVLLRALRESRRVDVLSRPQIRTLDNQPAFIQVGQRVPRIVGSTVNQNGQSNSVALENVGLILGVTPRISPEGNVVMEIDAEKSALGQELDGIPVAVSIDGTVIRSPRVDTTTAQATVSAADGETIVLGGLITERDEYVHRSVPMLGNIPILEHFFRFDSKVGRKTELLIILTPHVIRTPEDNERVRQAEMARMSWCACDVFRLMDDIGYYPESSFDQVETGSPEVIYPDLNPSGIVEPMTTISPPTPSPEPLIRIEGPDGELLDQQR